MILLIDPGRDPATVALISDGVVVAERTVAEKRQLSRTLLAMIDSVLQEHQATVPGLEAIAVVRGPGPFTSLRIGLAVANALAVAAARPLVGLTNQPARPIGALVSEAATKLAAGETASSLLPYYDRPPAITPPRAGRSA